MRSENSIHRKIPDNNGFQSFYCRVFFSSTKRCTDCFHKALLLLTTTEVFQSPNGVQIALSLRLTTSVIRLRFNHQTVYRLLVGSSDSPGNIPDVSITKRCTDCFLGVLNDPELNRFQSPNGVQIAFPDKNTKITRVFVSITKRCTDCFDKKTEEMIEEKFQSPNGVQIAFGKLQNRGDRKINVSITKRCTDCFADSLTSTVPHLCFNHQTVYRLLSIGVEFRIREYYVSITKRCTDCFFSISGNQTDAEIGFNHQTVYRLLRSDSWLVPVVEVSITKRCTDCFLYGQQDDSRGNRVSITKRCTDCFT